MRQAPATAPAAAWSPLGHRRFRILWLAFLGAQVVIWAQTVGAVAVIDGAGASMVAARSALAALTVAGLVTPAIVLGATAVLGAGLAMFLPAFSAMVPDLVPRPMLVPAVAMTGVTVNIARAAGPRSPARSSPSAAPVSCFGCCPGSSPPWS